MTREQLNTIREAIRPLDCGHHYCRYCDAGTSNHWEHDVNCPYMRSCQVAEDARAIIDAALKGARD